MKQKTISELFDYDGKHLRWKKRPHKSHFDISKPAGCIHPIKGYRQVLANGKLYLHSHLVYCYVHGVMPKQIDHINRDRADDRISNLRESNPKINRHNVKTTSNAGHKYIRKELLKNGGFMWDFCVQWDRNKKRFWKRFKTLNEALHYRTAWLMLHSPERLENLNESTPAFKLNIGRL